LAALPAHLVVELPVISPPSLVLVLFGTNCLEALIGATAVRALSDAPARFDTLPRVAAFVVGAGMLGPFLSSFVGAAAGSGWLGGAVGLGGGSAFFPDPGALAGAGPRHRVRGPIGLGPCAPGESLPPIGSGAAGRRHHLRRGGLLLRPFRRGEPGARLPAYA